ncbi:Hypothetical protein CFV354_1550 [Campylobacter fetus subsp. venerealis NCTC 10354]|nr:Hypothetical protein CFV354_1550 [Campylobacter fetus subsp. venerealis NCTC 10354]
MVSLTTQLSLILRRKMKYYKICKKCKCVEPATYSRCPACGYRLSILEIQSKDVTKDNKNKKELKCVI